MNRILTVITDKEGEMDIIISNVSGKPIYEQIYDQIKEKIVSETLIENDILPSIRSLARDLKISVITTKRAYDELEKDGFIYTIPSKGSYVKGRNLELVREEYLKEVEDFLRNAKASGYLAGIDDKELLEIFKYILEENN